MIINRINKATIKKNLTQIFALTERNIKLKLRFKFSLIISYFLPIISILMPIIILSKFFSLNNQFGPWTTTNYLIYQFIAYKIYSIKGITSEFPHQIREEKFWKTLPALIIGPFNRYNILLGIFTSHILLISIPFITFFILCFLIAPISFITLISIIGIYIIITLIFSGIGLVFGIFSASNENMWKFLEFGFGLLFWLSCITYPYELFPGFIQNLINLNPLYYLFDILRWTWIDNNPILTVATYPYHFTILIACGVIVPPIGIYIFDKIYNVYGIMGY
ncbi:MAG: ABC transporter permease [Promethearchaeota archaeon]